MEISGACTPQGGAPSRREAPSHGAATEEGRGEEMQKEKQGKFRHK